MQFQFKNDLIYKILRERILNGSYPVGMKLPPETEFARELQVGKVTLRSALARLEQESLIVRMRSRGTFVAESKLGGVRKLAVIMSNDNNVGTPAPYLMKFLVKAAERRGIVLEVLDSTLIAMLPEKTINRFFKGKGIEGVILMTGYFTGGEPLVSRMRSLRLPVVLPHGEMGDAARTGFASVVVDERKAFAETIEFMLAKPFRRIAVIGRNVDQCDRCRGFSGGEIRKICKGRLCDLSYLQYDPDKINAHIGQLYRDPVRAPDAFICYSDLYAIFLLAVLKKMDIKVPEDVSVIGFSGFNCDFRPDLKLAGVKYRYAEMVESALDLMNNFREWFDPDAPRKAPEIYAEWDFEHSGSVK